MAPLLHVIMASAASCCDPQTHSPSTRVVCGMTTRSLEALPPVVLLLLLLLRSVRCGA